MMLSYSKYKTYETCPYKYYLTYVVRNTEVKDKTPQMERGSNIHKKVEDYLLCTDADELSGDVLYNRDFISNLKHRSQPLLIEKELAVDQDGNSVGFHDPQVWLRAKLDAYFIVRDCLVILDWKTGWRYDYSDQLELYGMLGLLTYPEVSTARGYVIYLDQSSMGGMCEVTRGDLPEIKKRWMAKYKELSEATSFPRNKKTCRWCAYKPLCDEDARQNRIMTRVRKCAMAA